MKQRIGFFLLLCAIVLAAHAPALRAGFVWDDTALVLRDPLIPSWRLISYCFEQPLFLDATPSNFYRPLQRVTYTLEYWAVAFRPALYHASNFLLHAAAAFAFFLFASVFLKLFLVSDRRSLLIAAAAAIAWAVHPLHSAVVDYISGRADSLAALFGFAGLYLATRAISRGWKFQVAPAALFLGAALSRESGLLFPLIWIALLCWQKKWRALLPASAAILFLATIYMALRAQLYPVQVPRLTPPAPLVLRPILTARAIAEYAGIFVLPTNLHVDRDVESHPWGFSPASLTATSLRELQTLAGVILLGLAIFWFVRGARRGSPSAPLLIFAAISYLPVSGIFALNASVAEHWIYVPSAFLMLALFSELARLLQFAARNKFAVGTIGFCGLAWISFLAIRSFYRARDWHDNETFFQRTIASGGDSARMFINLAGAELSQDHLDRAQAASRVALQKAPNQPFAFINLAGVEIERGNFDPARKILAAARANPVTEAQADELLAVLEMKQSGKIDLLRWRLAARDASPNWAIERRYLQALDERGGTQKAVEELERVLSREWFRAESWQLLSQYLTKLGRASEAAQALAQARRYDIHLAEH